MDIYTLNQTNQKGCTMNAFSVLGTVNLFSANHHSHNPKTDPDAECKPLVVRPRRRSYIMSRDVVYDYHIGHEFVVVDKLSPYAGCTISVLDAQTLRKDYGYTELHVRYNDGMAPTRISLEPRR